MEQSVDLLSLKNIQELGFVYILLSNFEMTDVVFFIFSRAVAWSITPPSISLASPASLSQARAPNFSTRGGGLESHDLTRVWLKSQI